ncbi:MAG: hypothetical protein P8Y23_05025 [Candidatus Lokiarchaeota archaeon]
MVNKKGKFRLLSYLVDDNLIYYRSINKEKKILAFAIFELLTFYPVNNMLEEFLKQGSILFYSIEINLINPDKNFYIICLKQDNKCEIFKNFNSISDKLNHVSHSINFLKEKNLEKEFLNILSFDINKNNLVSDAIGSLRVKNTTIKTLDFYLVNYYKVGIPSDIIYQLIDYLRSLKRYGYLVINFQIINNKVSAEIYLIDIIEDLNSHNSNLENIINKFFSIEIIEKIRLEIKNIFYPLWRYRLTKSNFNQDISKIVLYFERYYTHNNLQRFNIEFKELLEANDIHYNQFSRNLFFIEQSTLVIIFANMRFKFLLDIIKKFRLKYSLILILLNDKDFEDLMQVENVNNISNLTILNYADFIQFDFKSLKVVNP